MPIFMNVRSSVTIFGLAFNTADAGCLPECFRKESERRDVPVLLDQRHSRIAARRIRQRTDDAAVKETVLLNATVRWC